MRRDLYKPTPEQLREALSDGFTHAIRQGVNIELYQSQQAFDGRCEELLETNGTDEHEEINGVGPYGVLNDKTINFFRY